MLLCIAGPILLEIGLEDLDYMDITVLAHRKVGGATKERQGGRGMTY